MGTTASSPQGEESDDRSAADRAGWATRGAAAQSGWPSAVGQAATGRVAGGDDAKAEGGDLAWHLHDEIRRLYALGPTAMGEQAWMAELRRRAEAAEHARIEQSLRLAAEEDRAAALQDQVEALRAARDEQERAIAALRARAQIAERERDGLRFRIERYRRVGEQHLAEMLALGEECCRRAERAERERDALSARLREVGP